MWCDTISLSSAGSLSVAFVALLFTGYQGWFYLRRPALSWNGWAALLSLSTAFFSATVFIQLNTTEGPINYFAEHVQLTVIILIVHSAQAFTLTLFGYPSKAYHKVFIPFHGVISFALWLPNLIIADHFIHRELTWLDRPYIEPQLGIFGHAFMAYVGLAFLGPVVVCIRSIRAKKSSAAMIISVAIVWGALGVHDTLVILGIQTFHFLMEYGFLVFSTGVLSVTLREHLRLYDEIEAREEHLAQEKERLDVTLRSIGDAFIATDIEGRVTLFNKAAEELSGLTTEEALGRPIRDVIEACRWNPTNLVGPTSCGDGRRRVSGKWTSLDGIQRHVIETRSTIHDRRRSVIGEVYVLHDDTERQKMRDHLERAKRMEAIGTLAGGVAHDLNNILAGVIAYPEMMLSRMPVDDPLRKHLESIQGAGARASAIARDLLTMARRNVPTLDRVVLNDLVEDFIRSPEFANLRLRHPAAVVETNLGQVDGDILGSPVQMMRALMNLIANSMEALSGGGTIHITSSTYYLDNPRLGYEHIPAGSYAILAISDSGVGIEAEDIKKIFEPFYTNKKMGLSGTGIGMALVYAIVKDHDGFIDVESVQGTSTTFTVYLPLNCGVVEINDSSDGGEEPEPSTGRSPRS